MAVLQKKFYILNFCKILGKLCKKSILKLKIVINHIKRKVKTIMIKKIFGSTLKVRDRVLLKNVSERGGGKLRSFFEDNTYNVASCHSDLPIYQIKLEKGGKIRTVHRNLLKTCNGLPTETEKLFSSLSNKKKCKNSKNQSECDSYSPTSDTDFDF